MAVEVLPVETPVIHFKSDGIQPPSDLYMTRDDALFITSYNSATGLRVAVRFTMMRADGKLVPGALDTHVPNTDRTAATTRMPLGEGFLLSASVFLDSGSAKRGQCYVQVGIARGVGSSQFIHRVILQGYVGTAANLAWPGNRLEQPTEGPGILRSIVGTNPAVGAEQSETVPTGCRQRLVTFAGTFTTSATVANRQPHLRFRSGGSVLAMFALPATQPASTAATVYWASGVALASALSSICNVGALPPSFWLLAGYIIETVTNNLQAADDWDSPTYLVEEWIEP